MVEPPPKRPNLDFGPSFWEAEGLKIMKRSRLGSKLTRKRRFRSHFGTSPKVISEVWHRLDPLNAWDDANGVRPVHLLWALLFLKIYGTEAVHCTLAGGKEYGPDETTFRKWVWIFVDAVAMLEGDVVSYNRTPCIYIMNSYLIVSILDLVEESQGRGHRQRLLLVSRRF